MSIAPALLSSQSNEWFTPAKYIAAARQVMGGAIELDPASCEEANLVVKAARYYTQAEDGLSQPWHARSLWLNPPYGKTGKTSNQAFWTHKLIAEYRAGNVAEAILLVNAVTDCAWFAPLWEQFICFTNHRIKFYNSAGQPDSPTKGNAFVYFGPQSEIFRTAFSQFGAVVSRVQS